LRHKSQCNFGEFPRVPRCALSVAYTTRAPRPFLANGHKSMYLFAQYFPISQRFLLLFVIKLFTTKHRLSGISLGNGYFPGLFFLSLGNCQECFENVLECVRRLIGNMAKMSGIGRGIGNTKFLKIYRNWFGIKSDNMDINLWNFLIQNSRPRNTQEILTNSRYFFNLP